MVKNVIAIRFEINYHYVSKNILITGGLRGNLRVALKQTNILPVGATAVKILDFFLQTFENGGKSVSLPVEGEAKDKNVVNIEAHKKLDDKQRRQMQHEIKVYMEQYFKQKLGKGVDYTKVVIWEDMMIIRGERFLTDPEIYIVETPAGREVVRAARMQVAKQHSIDNVSFFEEKLGARVINQTYDIVPENDFWIHVMVFDRSLTE